MNSNVTALVVAVVGVAGTLFAALLTQRSYMRSKKLELSDQQKQREAEQLRVNLKERRDVYIGLNAAARGYRRAMKNYLFEYTDQTKADLDRAWQEFNHCYAEEQLIAHAEVLKVAHSASTELAEAFGRIKKFDAQRQRGVLAGSGDQDEHEALIAMLDGSVAEVLRLLRRVMREDLGVTETT